MRRMKRSSSALELVKTKVMSRPDPSPERWPITATPPRHRRQRAVVTLLYQRTVRHRHVCLLLLQCLGVLQQNVVGATWWRLNLLGVTWPAEICTTRRTRLNTTPLTVLARLRRPMYQSTHSSNRRLGRPQDKVETAIVKSPSPRVTLSEPSEKHSSSSATLQKNMSPASQSSLRAFASPSVRAWET